MNLTHKMLIHSPDFGELKEILKDLSWKFKDGTPTIVDIGCAVLVFSKYAPDLIYASVLITESKAIDMVYFISEKLTMEGFENEVLPI